MSLIMDYKELYKVFSDRDPKYTLDSAMKYWKSIADASKISSDVVEVAINRGFSKLAHGEKFDYPCPCGCEINGVATTFIHSVRDDILSIDKDIQIETSKILNDRFKNVIEAQMKKISKTNKEFIKMNRPPLSERSPILRGIKNAWKKITAKDAE